MSSRTDWSVKQKWSEHRSVGSDSLQPHGLYSPWNFPGQNAWVDSLSLLQGIFPTQGSNPGLLHCRWILYPLSHQGSPRILEWVAYPFSRESSKPRNQTGASCIAGRFFTNELSGKPSETEASVLLISFYYVPGTVVSILNLLKPSVLIKPL